MDSWLATPRSWSIGFWLSGWRVVIVLASLRVFGQNPPAARFTGIPAVYSPGPAGMGQQGLALFGNKSPNPRISLPFTLGVFTLNPRGNVLYAEIGQSTPDDQPPRPGLVKIDLRSMQTGTVPGSQAFTAVFSIAASANEDFLMLSGNHWTDKGLNCGLFMITQPLGAVRQIISTGDCRASESFSSVSLAPDGRRAVAIRHGSVELIDVTRGTLRQLEKGYYKSAWSPDGKYIAAVEHNGKTADLLGGETYERKAAIDADSASWSPDSRRLLAFQSDMSCGPEVYSLVQIDVRTGDRSAISGSRRRLAGGATLWVNEELMRH